MKFFPILLVTAMFAGALDSNAQNQAKLMIPPATMPYDAGTNQIVFSKVIEIKGLNKGELLTLGKKFYIEKLGGTDKNVKLEDKENGFLESDAFYKIQAKNLISTLPEVMYTYEVRSKDDKVKVSLIPKQMTEYNGSREVQLQYAIPFPEWEGMFKKMQDKKRNYYYVEIEREFYAYLASLEAYMLDQGSKSLKAKDF
jgi:hypothetical protein